MSNLDQKHPQETKDRLILDDLLTGEPSDRNLVELARLIIRYRNFPGAREIQRDLEVVLHNWQLSEAELYAKTRQIHASGKIYRTTATGEQQDWS